MKENGDQGSFLLGGAPPGGAPPGGAPPGRKT